MRVVLANRFFLTTIVVTSAVRLRYGLVTSDGRALPLQRNVAHNVIATGSRQVGNRMPWRGRIPHELRSTEGPAAS
jgi:hypothetical protein